MWVSIWATEGLSAIALACNPPSGRAPSRLTRMVLLRSQESRRASSRRGSGASGMAAAGPFQSSMGQHFFDQAACRTGLFGRDETPLHAFHVGAPGGMVGVLDQPVDRLGGEGGQIPPAAEVVVDDAARVVGLVVAQGEDAHRNAEENAFLDGAQAAVGDGD